MSAKEQTRKDDRTGSKQRPPQPASENVAELVTLPPHPVPLTQRAGRAPASLTPPDVMQLQRTIGNRGVGQLLTGAARPQLIQNKNSPSRADSRKTAFEIQQKRNENSETVLQRASNIEDDDVWSDNHEGNITLGSGSATTEKLSVEITDTIAAKVMEKDLNHFCTGHTIKEFSFDEENIERSPRSGFWPADYGADEVLEQAEAVLESLKDEIEEAVGYGSSINLRSHEYGDFKYVVTISTEEDTEAETDEETGMYLSGTARLEQFYPISGTGFLYADKEDLTAVKQRLGK